MQLSISSPHLRTQKIQYSDKVSLPDVYLVGDLIGTLSDDGSINNLSRPATNKLLSAILKADPNVFPEFDYLSCIGGFAVIVFYPWLNKLYIACSTTCPSPYILFSSDSLIISFDENSLLEKYGARFTSEIVGYIGDSHQLVVRPPLSFFGLKNSLRVPAGHQAIISLSNFKNDVVPFIRGNSTNINLFNLSNSLKSILSLYNSFYHGDIGVSFSGGLDSSCLASILSNLGLDQIPMIHLDYHGSSSPRSSVSYNIAKQLGFSNILHLPRFGSKVTLDGLIDTLLSSFMQLPNEMYIGNPSQFYKHTFPKYMITGQGADSIYAIDTFAPPTELTGINRISQIVKGCDLRLDFSTSRINKTLGSSSSELSFTNHTIPKALKSIVASQAYTLNEHAPYRPLFPKSMSNSNSVSHSLSYKQNLQLLSKYAFGDVNNSSVYRYIKWIRANVNVSNQYHNFIPQQSYKLTPFLEGPIVKQFFNYEISDFECLSVKPHFETLFTLNCGFSHRRLVEDILGSSAASQYGPKADVELDRARESEMRQSLFQHLFSIFKSSHHSQSLNYGPKSLTPLMRTSILFNSLQ